MDNVGIAYGPLIECMWTPRTYAFQLRFQKCEMLICMLLIFLPDEANPKTNQRNGQNCV